MANTKETKTPNLGNKAVVEKVALEAYVEQLQAEKPERAQGKGNSRGR